MKILKGSLTETIYGWPCQDSENPAECATAADSLYPSTKHTCQARGSATGPSELHVRKETTYEREQVTYMSDSLGLHRIRNPSESEYAISLHLYTVSIHGISKSSGSQDLFSSRSRLALIKSTMC